MERGGATFCKSETDAQRRGVVVVAVVDNAQPSLPRRRRRRLAAVAAPFLSTAPTSNPPQSLTLDTDPLPSPFLTPPAFSGPFKETPPTPKKTNIPRLKPPFFSNTSKRMFATVRGPLFGSHRPRGDDDLVDADNDDANTSSSFSAVSEGGTQKRARDPPPHFCRPRPL